MGPNEDLDEYKMDPNVLFMNPAPSQQSSTSSGSMPSGQRDSNTGVGSNIIDPHFQESLTIVRDGNNTRGKIVITVYEEGKNAFIKHETIEPRKFSETLLKSVTPNEAYHYHVALESQIRGDELLTGVNDVMINELNTAYNDDQTTENIYASKLKKYSNILNYNTDLAQGTLTKDSNIKVSQLKRVFTGYNEVLQQRQDRSMETLRHNENMLRNKFDNHFTMKKVAENTLLDNNPRGTISSTFHMHRYKLKK